MKITDIDYYSIYGNSYLHKVSVNKKLLWAFALIILILVSYNIKLLAIVYLTMFLYIIFSKLPSKIILILSYYPLIFTLLLLLSFKNISIEYVIIFVLRVLIASSSLILLFITTPYMNIFYKLRKILPSFLITSFLLTYRSLFILSTVLETINTTLYLRGGLSKNKVKRSLKVLSNSLGFLVIKSIESSEKMHETMQLKGYSNKLNYLEDK